MWLCDLETTLFPFNTKEPYVTYFSTTWFSVSLLLLHRMFDEGCSNVSSITGIYINKVQQWGISWARKVYQYTSRKISCKNSALCLSLKDQTFELFEPANKEEMESLESALSVFESNTVSSHFLLLLILANFQSSINSTNPTASHARIPFR